MWLLYRRLRLRRKQRVRKYWVHPINERRNVMGTFNSLFEDLLADENKFFNYFRMSISSFDELHNRLKCSIQRQNTKMRDCIQPKEMLAVTLRLVQHTLLPKPFLFHSYPYTVLGIYPIRWVCIPQQRLKCLCQYPCLFYYF
uniref:Protein ALP1-like n=1 Tax=Sipha flava TaxID=143950 RepID=A0A2S2PUR2_9HEMI